MRYLAVSRFRLLTFVRAATPIFVLAMLPPLLGTIAVARPEPVFREEADFWLQINAWAVVMGWVFHTLLLAIASLMSGKVKTMHDFVLMDGVPDLMDTAPIGNGSRFWGEALGTMAATVVIHLCCLPLLTAIAALSPLPITVFVWIEAAALALFFLASAGAAWQRRAPRTKFSGTRGPRNAFVFAVLALLAVLVSTSPAGFRDSVLSFLFYGSSPRGWSEVVRSVENPVLLVTLWSMLYVGTITYYYWSATRKRIWES